MIEFLRNRFLLLLACKTIQHVASEDGNSLVSSNALKYAMQNKISHIEKHPQISLINKYTQINFISRKN